MSDEPLGQRTVLISVNPKAGRKSPREKAERLKLVLVKKGFNAEIHTDLDIVSQRANSLFENSKLQALVGVGGDGTAAELTNRTLPGVPITLLPSGTANLIAKYLKLPFNPDRSADMIASGSTISLDAGKANGRLFLVMISAGIDAEIVRLVHASREANYRNQTKKGAHISYLSYLKPIFRTVNRYKYHNVQTKIQYGNPVETTSDAIVGKWSFVFNLPRYGWGLPLVPQCVGNDNELDYCIFQGGKLFTALFDVACAQFFSMHRFLPNTKIGRGSRFLIDVDPNEKLVDAVPYQIDGDPGGVLPVEVEIEPNRFTALAPRKTIEKLARKNTSH